MTCLNNANITLRFPAIGLEIQPYTVDFRIDRGKFDYLDAKFSSEVGDYLKPLTDEIGGALRRPQPAEVVMDGEATHWMYFRPEYATYGETNAWVELHDPLKHLKYTTIDKKYSGVTAANAYKRVVDLGKDNGIIQDVKFNIPNSASTKYPDYVPVGPGGYSLVPAVPVAVDAAESTYDVFARLNADYDEGPDRVDSSNIVSSKYNFDLKNKNCLEAIVKMNDDLGLESWMDANGVLKVGLDFFNSAHHVASSSDSRVWRYNNPEITPPSTPVKMVVVNGGMIDLRGTKDEGVLEQIDEFFFSPKESHKNDLRAQGVAQRPGVMDGKIISVDKPNLDRSSLEDRAKQILATETIKNQPGSVEINPDTSGTHISDWRNVQVGDFLQLIPGDEDDCGEIERQMTLISGVKHNVDGGSWTLDLDVQKWTNPQTVTTFRYFNPDNEEYYTVDGDGNLEKM